MVSSSLPPKQMITASIIIPCYNEQSTIKDLLEALNEQTFPREEMEIVIADGMSEDSTRAEISAFATAHPSLRITVVDNPKRIIPAAVNIAIRASRGRILIRLDGHSLPYPDYVEHCVADLDSELGANVGGIWEIKPGAPGGIAAAIAAAASHPLGAGDALYRLASRPASVDTVPFGAFKRELLATIGFFDETLLSNEDYEFNVRIRQAGGIIWLDPAIRSIYFARSTFRSLARQYWRYGYWKWQMLRRYPDTLRWRQALPPIFTTGLLLGLPLSIFIPVLRLPFTAAVCAYVLILCIAGLQSSIKHKNILHLACLPLAIGFMHVSWGGGFLWSMIGGKDKNSRNTGTK